MNLSAVSNVFIFYNSPNQFGGNYHDVDSFDTDERRNHAADSVNEQIASQQISRPLAAR